MHGEAYRQFTADLGLVALRETVSSFWKHEVICNYENKQKI